MLTSWVPLCATSLAGTSKRDRLPHTQFRVAWQARRARTLRHALAVLWTHALVRDEVLQCTAVMTVACRDQPHGFARGVGRLGTRLDACDDAW